MSLPAYSGAPMCVNMGFSECVVDLTRLAIIKHEHFTCLLIARCVPQDCKYLCAPTPKPHTKVPRCHCCNE